MFRAEKSVGTDDVTPRRIKRWRSKDGGQAQDRQAEKAAATPKAGANVASSGKPKRKHYTGRPKGADETRRLDEARSKLATVRGNIGELNLLKNWCGSFMVSRDRIGERNSGTSKF